MGKQVPLLDPIPEQSARLRVIPVCLRQMMEEIPGHDFLLDLLSGLLPCIMKQKWLVLFYGFHELIAHADGNIGLGDLVQIRLQIHELLHVRMGAVYGNHQRSPSSVLPDQACHQGIQLHKGYRAAGLLGRVVDGRSPGTQTGDVNAAAASIAVGSGQLRRAVENTLDVILRRRNHITVGQADLLPILLKSPVGQDSSAKQEFLLLHQPCDVRVAPADTGNPLLKAFILKAVFLSPDVRSQLVIFPQPFLFIHLLPLPFYDEARYIVVHLLC